MNDLLRAAIEARERACAPYSGFRVGAAVEDEHGRIFTGCNIESASYGLSMCAERVAVFKAVSEGASELKRVALVTDTQDVTTPCGACRQVLSEFCGNGEIILANLAGREETLPLASLLPRRFSARDFLK